MKHYLTELRKECGLTQKELADKLHISQSCISRIENNKCEISPFLLDDLAKFFHVRPEYILGEISNKSESRERIEVTGIYEYEEVVLRYKRLNDEHKTAIKLMLDFYYQFENEQKLKNNST